LLKLIGGSGLCVREECKEGTVWESDPKLCGTSRCLVVSLSVPYFFSSSGCGHMEVHGRKWHSSTARHGTARHGTAREWHGTARHSTAQHGTVRHHTARQQHGTTPLWYVALSRCQYPFFFYRDVDTWKCTAENGTASHSTATHGITHGKATHGNTWHGNKHHSGTQHSNTRHGAARHQTSRDCHSTRLLRHGTARHETATA